MAALLTLSLITVYYYGFRAVLIIFITLLTFIISDASCMKIRKKPYAAADLGASVIAGLTLALMMSAAVPYNIAVISALFASVIGRQAFGGQRHEIFNPAAVGFLFAALCFSDAMLSYPKPFDKPELASVIPLEMLSPSINRALVASSSPLITFMDVLIGKLPAPMGTAYLLLLAVCALVLICRRSVSAVGFFTQLGIVTVFSYIYFDYNMLAVFNMLSGSMFVFGLLFLSCVKKKTSRASSSWFILGVLTSIAFLTLEFYSKTENAIIFAVIIATPFGVDLDRHSFAEVLKKGSSGIIYKVRSRFNKQLVNVNETLALLDERGTEEQREEKGN